MKRLFTLCAALLALLLPQAAPNDAGPDRSLSESEVETELSRQLESLDLSSWDEYLDGLYRFSGGSFSDLDSLLLELSEGGSGAPEGLWELLRAMLASEVKKAGGPIALLCAAALMTALPGILGGEGAADAASLVLCISAVTLSSGMLASLCTVASEAVSAVADFTQSTVPIMSALLVSSGASASAGIFRPLMVFLSETVLLVIERAVIPLVLAGGVLSLLDALTGGVKLSELVKLARKAAGWILGLLSTFYFGMTAVRGMSVAARDGVSIRTAKYALDKLVPIVGGMVSGTVDSVMGCALLIKNGVGSLAIVILLSIIARPLIVLGAGILIFRLAAAITQPIAASSVVRLYSGAADTARYLFACVAASGCMLTVLCLVFIAAGGVTAGLW